MLGTIQATQGRHGNRLEEIGEGLGKLRGTQERQWNRLEEIGQDVAGLRGEVANILELLRGGGQEPL